MSIIEIRAEFEARLVQLQETFDREECDGLVRSLAVVGDMVEIAFDTRTANRAMTALRTVFNTAPASDVDWVTVRGRQPDAAWREEWDGLDAFNDTYWSETMENTHNLHAYTYFGIHPGWAALNPGGQLPASTSNSLNIPSFVEATVAKLRAFTALFPRGDRFANDLDPIESLCRAATGRLKLDRGDALTVHELAALTRVSTKRLQNAIYARSDEAPVPHKNGNISPASAERWLISREYLPSLWQDFINARCWEVSVAEPERLTDSPTPAASEYLFVPEAADGSLFGPKSCLRPGAPSQEPHYAIGEKSSEQKIREYEEALAALSAMPIPRWRRPNEHGRFGIVTGRSWRRLSRSELRDM